MLKKSKIIFVTFIGSVLLCWWYLLANLNSTNNIFSQSYIVLTLGNGLNQHSAIQSSNVQHGKTVFFLNKDTIRKSKMFLTRSSIPKNHSQVEGDSIQPNPSNTFHMFLWDEVCTTKLTSILNHPLFPNLPLEKRFTNKLHFERITRNIGIYSFGILSPKTSGNYVLQVICAGIVMKMWLNNIHEPFSYNMLHDDYTIDIRGSRTKQSNTLKLKENENYVFVILLKTDVNIGSFLLKWKLLDSNSDFEPIPSTMYHRLSEKHKIFQQLISRDMPLFERQRKPSDLYKSKENLKRSRMYTLPFINEEDARNLFPVCDYSPSYKVKKKLSKYMGQWETHFSSVYPKDETDIPYYYPGVEKPHIIFGNPVIDSEQAENVVGKVMEAISKQHQKKYRLESVLSVEENKDEVKGSRYLIELELKASNDRVVRFSEYVFQPKNNPTELCYPKNFTWNKTADVNYILTSAGQSRWVVHFINEMSRIYSETKDPNMNVIIADFDTSDVDLVEVLQSSSLQRYTLIKRRGRFHKTLAIQDAAATISNPNAIALQVDLHLTIPFDFTDNVRKHTVKGKMAYSPLLVRLQCGATPQQPNGFWEVEGYGIFATYKADWNLIGGMNVRQFKDNWGGEDWELLDSVLNHGYEVERLKIKNFNHVFHSKKKMWNSFESDENKFL